MQDPDSPKTIVVTGLGVITSLGLEVDTFWSNLTAGKSGVSLIDSFDTTLFTSKIGGEIRDFDARNYMDPKEVRRNDRYTHFAMAAAKEAVADANLDFETEDPARIGVFVGSGIGGMATIEAQAKALFMGGPRKVSPFMIPSLIANMASGMIGIEYGVRGPNFSIVSACATGTHCIGESLKTLRVGDADVMIAGGSEASITALGFAGFCSMKAMSRRNDDPEGASRPFSQGRDGFVMGEGAGVLILETLEHAQARGAKIYCELAGYGASCDSYHITKPEPEGKGLTLAMNQALKTAGEEPENIDYINAHGTSTPFNDKFETLAMKNVFGEHAYKLKISSTKSMTGHLLGAAGGVESAISVKTIQTGVIAPTINYNEPDPECDLDYVPNTKQEMPVKTVMTNNLGFGGQNASLVFRAL
ncbi:MAG: beta-ketoacyl-ACP synthase II [Opitutaceae bacterium]|nr:beta-ketoacyl-ACP synthase II [Opitutaceae bacterium]